MKKIALLFGAAVFALTSCSKDSATSTTASSGLVKTITDSDGVSTATYNGSKLVKTEGTGHSETYTYTGDLISSVSYVDDNGLNSTDYTYQNGKLISSVDKSNEGSGTAMTVVFNSTYTYNSDGTITVQQYQTLEGESTPTLQASTKYTFQNGNMVKQENFDESGVSHGTITYEYDNKKNPANNIVGFAKIIDNEEVSVNNITKSTETSGSGDTLTATVTTNAYTYNANGYPVTMTSTIVSTNGTDAPQTTTETTHYTY